MNKVPTDGERPGNPLAGLPAVLTVEEAAQVLRIGRGAAYELARQWRESGGRHGLPVVTLGRSLRVPRDALERMLCLDVESRAFAPAERGRGRGIA